MKPKEKHCKTCGALLWTFQLGELCMDFQYRKAQDDRERCRVQLIARAAGKLEHGEALNLAEAAVMADSVGMSYGYYSHHLSVQTADKMGLSPTSISGCRRTALAALTIPEDAPENTMRVK